MRQFVTAIGLAVVLSIAGEGTVRAQQPGAPQTLAESPLNIVTDTGTHRFTVMVADDPNERATGLMFRETMDIDKGMLFVFGREAPRAFWMKDTPLSLDIIFLDAQGRVVNIAKGTTPFSLDSVPSADDAKYVLELNAGVSDLIRLKPGDPVEHRVIGR